MRAEFPDLPVGLVAIDNREIGRIQGRQVKAVLGEGPATILAVLGSVQTSAARDRRAGLQEVLTASATVVDLEGMWSAESADRVVTRWLGSAGTDGGLQAVAAQNDPMAVGARQALLRLAKERRRPEWTTVPVFGVDGLSAEGQRLVDERTLAATVVVPPTSGAAVELLARFWHSAAPIPAKVMLDPKPYPAGR
jgi:ABC-type sugar transport system substrate-binding protein